VLLILAAALTFDCKRGPTAPTGGGPGAPGGHTHSPAPAPSATPTPEATPTPLPTPSSPILGTKSVTGLVLGGHVFPQEQFKVAGPDSCNESHYHQMSLDIPLSIGTLGILDLIVCHPSLQTIPYTPWADYIREGRQMRDPDPTGCGYGKVSEVSVVSNLISSGCYANWWDLWH
jgi:hypothetical protein